MFINNVRILNTGRLYVPGGGYEYINETRGVPEGSVYKLRFIIRDDLTNKRTTASIYKVINCIEDDDPSSTTTTIQEDCLLYTSPSPRDKRQSRMPSSA